MYSVLNYLSPTESTLFSWPHYIVTAQKFSSPTAISWNWKVLSLVAAARVSSGLLWALLFALRLLTQTIPFSLCFFLAGVLMVLQSQPAVIKDTCPNTLPSFQPLTTLNEERVAAL